jgi:hypothetical protein
MMKTMAQSPAMLEASLISGSLGHGLLNAETREHLALVVGHTDACEYLLSIAA